MEGIKDHDKKERVGYLTWIHPTVYARDGARPPYPQGRQAAFVEESIKLISACCSTVIAMQESEDSADELDHPIKQINPPQWWQWPK